MICLTFDVEERFHSHLTPAGTPRRWSAGDRIAQILDLLLAKRRRATLFVVSELAERYPELIRRMAADGFEVASHSHSHLLLDSSRREHCKQDIARSKGVLEELTGRPVLGFRAPSWSAQLADDWLWEHLARLGFGYDSSLFPFRTHRYGSFRNAVLPFRLGSGLVEIPPSVTELGPLRLPYGGGFFFRLYPLWLTRALIERDVAAHRTPVVYFHPWEFDPPATPVEAGALNRFIANYGSGKAWAGLGSLLDRYETVGMSDLAAAFAGSDGER